MSAKKSQPVYQVKITLNGTKPPVWRRMLVPGTIRLDRFHDVLQTVMGWTDSHLHQFISGRTFYGIPYDDLAFGLETMDERKYKLSQLLKKEKDSIIYEYDFGDSWEHRIVLEKILPANSDVVLPSCIKGKRACPPEDCGGVWGYQDLIEVIRNPSHPEYEEMLDWLGGEFDPEEFDLTNTNKMLARYCR